MSGREKNKSTAFIIAIFWTDMTWGFSVPLQDYSKFLDDNFDAKEWVNAAFRNHKETAISKDEVNNILEEASQQALQNLPRVMREIDAVRQEASLLQDQMRMVKEDIQKVEQSTAQSMQVLLKLDGIKGRMKTTAEALKEADNWTTLSADVEEVFHSNDIQAITDKLTGMQQSLQMLVDTPDYADRCQHLEKLKNRLEAILSPQLIAAFNTQSLESAKMYTKMFDNIERLPQLYKYYHKCHKGKILENWRDIVDNKQDETTIEWLTDLYDLLLSTWHSQINWCSQVFKDPVPIVCDLISESLNSLDPSILTCITGLITTRGDTLSTLTDLKKITERFAANIETTVESHMTDSLEHSTSLEKLLLSIYAPYRSYLPKYSTFQEVALIQDLDNIKMDHEEVMDTVQLLSETVNKLFSAANKANTRCQKLTNGFCYVGLLDAYKTYFLSYCREFRRVLINIREKCGINQGGEGEDWSNFQHSLRLIQTCGDLILHAEELDQEVVSSILHSVGRHIGSPVRDSDKRNLKNRHSLQFQASLFIDNKDDIETLEIMISKLEEGDTPPKLTDIKSEMCKLCEEVHKFGFEIVFAQLKKYLSNISNMEIWTSKRSEGALTSDLPSFSLSPQEYITKIGQYLMTIPQHLEPFMLHDNPTLTTALKYGKLPYIDDQDLPEHLADLWLESVAKGTMHIYCEEILKIINLSPHATKQLITDIEYLLNVLDDLGLQPTDNISNINILLLATPEDFTDKAETMPQRLTHAISAMRHIEI